MRTFDKKLRYMISYCGASAWSALNVTNATYLRMWKSANEGIMIM